MTGYITIGSIQLAEIRDELHDITIELKQMNKNIERLKYDDIIDHLKLANEIIESQRKIITQLRDDKNAL